jgi:hypothetical protein
LSNKSVRISVLAQEHGSGWWTRASYDEQVEYALTLAKQLFGKGGTRKGTWFHRTRYEWLDSAPDVIKRKWCDVYFKDPKDATWFQLKRDSLSSQTS